MAYETIVDGNTIMSTWGNASVRDQGVSPFATAAARDAAIVSPPAGQVCTTTDTSSIWVRGASSWAQIGPLAGWTTYTPTITQTVTVAKTVNYSKYCRIGRLVIWQASLSITSSGTSGAIVSVTLPATASSSSANTVIGSGYLNDSDQADQYAVMCRLASSTAFNLHTVHTSGTSPSPTMLNQSGFTGPGDLLESGDLLTFSIWYEAAS